MTDTKEQTATDPKQLPNWVLYKYKNGKPMPYRQGGEPADISNPETWMDYETARGYADSAGNGAFWAGIGFVLTNTSFKSADLDRMNFISFGKNKAEKPVKQIKVTRLSDVEECPTECLWEPYVLLGELTLFSGDPDTAKSYMSLLIASMLTIGKQFSAFSTDLEPCGPENVLIICEDSVSKTLKQRVSKCGGDQERFFHLDGLIKTEEGGEPTLCTLTADDIPAIEEAIKEHQPKLLIVDHLSDFGGDLNLNHASQMNKVTIPLKRLAEKYNMAVILVRHNRKSDEGDQAIYKGAGSISGTGKARSELASHKVEVSPTIAEGGLVVSAPDSHFAFVHIKHNLTAQGPSIAYSVRQGGVIQIDGISDKTEKDFMKSDDKTGISVDKCLYTYLATGPKPSFELEAWAESCGFSMWKIRRAAKQIGAVSKPTGFGEHREWRLLKMPIMVTVIPDSVPDTDIETFEFADSETEAMLAHIEDMLGCLVPDQPAKLVKGIQRYEFKTKDDVLTWFKTYENLDTHSAKLSATIENGTKNFVVDLSEVKGD